MTSTLMHDIHAHVRAVIHQMDYDFRQFSLADFVDHLIHIRQRHICVIPKDFAPGLHAMWLPYPTADYVFYNKNTHVIHQIHNILHELGHIVLDHARLDLADVLPPKLLAQLDRKPSTVVLGHARSGALHDTREELEAEAFVRQLQEQIVFANHIDELTNRSSSIAALAKYTRSLGYRD